jgi:hypothetical protein
MAIRLDKETRHRIARRRSPYKAVVDLIGVVHARAGKPEPRISRKNPKRSTASGGQFSELLKTRRSRS